MKLPIVLSDSGDVMIFKSVDDLKIYVEPEDLASYIFFDAGGQVINVRMKDSVRGGTASGAEITETGVYDGARLVEILGNFFHATSFDGGVNCSDLNEMIHSFTQKFGYTE